MNSTINIRNINNAAVAGNAGTRSFFPLPDFPRPRPTPPFPWNW
ncbi:MAG: hypothetical protein VZR11_09545 [Succinimonas sp.]|nr:hypothetical protein [Succinimonas sp.]